MGVHTYVGEREWVCGTLVGQVTQDNMSCVRMCVCIHACFCRVCVRVRVRVHVCIYILDMVPSCCSSPDTVAQPGSLAKLYSCHVIHHTALSRVQTWHKYHIPQRPGANALSVHFY